MPGITNYLFNVVPSIEGTSFRTPPMVCSQTCKVIDASTYQQNIGRTGYGKSRT